MEIRVFCVSFSVLLLVLLGLDSAKRLQAIRAVPIVCLLDTL